MIITGRKANPIKPDKVDCYQLSLSSKLDINKVLLFFSAEHSNTYPLIGYKSIQFKNWVHNLKLSNRYKNISFIVSMGE